MTHLSAKAERYLQKLCVDIPNRCVGSRGNRSATDFFTETIAGFGFKTETPEFDCIDWTENGADLTISDTAYEALVSPYSLSGQVEAPLVVVSTVADLEAADIANRVVLLHREIAGEQLMPKNFSFYNPDEHKHIVRLLEIGQPRAIVAATTKDPDVAGGVYPFPLIEDGDFDIPSVYMTAVEGERLAQQAGQTVSLDIRAARTPAKGCNVTARKGANAHRRAVIFAHIDAKIGTPGALDNGTGVTTLLLLADLLTDYSGGLGIEIVALNGEDHYSAIGEIEYLKRNEGLFGNIVLGINMDGLGYYKGKTAYSLYDCPDDIVAMLHEVFAGYPDMAEGQQWYQSDHSLFVMNQRPALALTSDQFDDLWRNIAHTEKDIPNIVDTVKLINAASAVRDVLLRLDKILA